MPIARNPLIERTCFGIKKKRLREGKKHTVYISRKKLKSSTIPRHREINDFLAKKICKDLEISAPK